MRYRLKVTLKEPSSFQPERRTDQLHRRAASLGVEASREVRRQPPGVANSGWLKGG